MSETIRTAQRPRTLGGKANTLRSSGVRFVRFARGATAAGDSPGGEVP